MSEAPEVGEIVYAGDDNNTCKMLPNGHYVVIDTPTHYGGYMTLRPLYDCDPIKRHRSVKANRFYGEYRTHLNINSEDGKAYLHRIARAKYERRKAIQQRRSRPFHVTVGAALKRAVSGVLPGGV